MKNKQLVTITLHLLSVVVGVLFLYSAYTKSIPIETFEYTMVQYLHLPWFMAAIAARLLVGLEAGIGFLFLGRLYGTGKWVLKASILLLISFSGYLIFLWGKFGNNINCGCFGDAIWMNPLASLLKNAGLLAVITLLFYRSKSLQFRWSRLSLYGVLFIAIILPFILFVLPTNKPDWLKNGGYTMNLAALYTGGKIDKPVNDLSKGKYVVAFLSPNCPHCRMAAYKMHLMHLNNPRLPFFLVIGGTKDLTEFWKVTQANDLQFSRLLAPDFFKLAGNELPSIVFISNGRVEAKADYNNLSEKSIEEWLNN